MKKFSIVISSLVMCTALAHGDVVQKEKNSQSTQEIVREQPSKTSVFVSGILGAGLVAVAFNDFARGLNNLNKTYIVSPSFGPIAFTVTTTNGVKIFLTLSAGVAALYHAICLHNKRKQSA